MMFQNTELNETSYGGKRETSKTKYILNTAYPNSFKIFNIHANILKARRSHKLFVPITSINFSEPVFPEHAHKSFVF